MTAKDIKNPEVWGKMLDKYGFSTVFAGVLCYIIWSIGWFVAGGHVRFLDSTVETQRQQAEISRQQVDVSQGIADGQKELRDLTLESTLILRGLKKDGE